MERDSLPGGVFTRSCQCFRAAQTLERGSLTGCSPILVSRSNLIKQWRGTHFLDHDGLPVLVSDPDLLKHSLPG